MAEAICRYHSTELAREIDVRAATGAYFNPTRLGPRRGRRESHGAGSLHPLLGASGTALLLPADFLALLILGRAFTLLLGLEAIGQQTPR